MSSEILIDEPDAGAASAGLPWLCLVLVVSAALKAIYVFGFTDYPHYVVSDPAHYFLRAMALYGGEGVGRADWEVFPMGSTVLLAGYWKALALLGCNHHQLESALALNVLASTLSVAVLWRIALRMSASPRFSLIVAAAYSLFYPLVYLNAFTLSEAPAQLLFMVSIWALLESQERRALAWLLLAGLAWALAVHCRSSFLLAGPAALCWLFWAQPTGGRVRSALAFLAPALLVFGLAAAALWQASAGTAHTATGRNGGLNFFMQQCQLHGVETSYENQHWIFIPPLYADQPQLGIYATHVPFYEQGFYYREGLRCLERDPGAARRLLAFAPTMLYGNFMPSWYSAAGFATALRQSQHATLLLLLASPLGYAALARRNRHGSALLLANAMLLLATFVLFNADHRHVYSLAFIYFLFGLAGWQSLWRMPRWRALRYLLAAGTLAGLAAWAFGGSGPLSLSVPHAERVGVERIATQLPDGTPWNHLDALRFGAPLSIELGARWHAANLQLSLDNNDSYRLDYYQGQHLLGASSIAPVTPRGLQAHRIEVPLAATLAGYDSLLLTALEGDGSYSVAGLQALP